MEPLDDNLLRVTGDGWDLLGQKCGACGLIAYPRKRVCPRCFSEDLAEQVLSKTGVLHTWTYTELGPERLGLPFALAMVDLPEGVRLMGLIDEPERFRDRLAVEMPVDLVLGSLIPNGEQSPAYIYKFRPRVGEAAA